MSEKISDCSVNQEQERVQSATESVRPRLQGNGAIFWLNTQIEE